MRVMTTISFRRIFVLGALFACGGAAAARAQFAVYGMVSAEKINGITCIDPRGVCAASGGTVQPYGGTLGAYYDWRSFGPARLGVDLRTSFLNSNKRADVYQGGTDIVRHYSGLGGVRATFNTPIRILKPYVQASAGVGRTNSAAIPYSTYTQVQGFAGLDLALGSNIDFRVLEVGAGELFGSGSHSVQSIGLGIVFHTTRDRQ